MSPQPDGLAMIRSLNESTPQRTRDSERELPAVAPASSLKYAVHEHVP